MNFYPGNLPFGSGSSLLAMTFHATLLHSFALFVSTLASCLVRVYKTHEFIQSPAKLYPYLFFCAVSTIAGRCVWWELLMEVFFIDIEEFFSCPFKSVSILQLTLWFLFWHLVLPAHKMILCYLLLLETSSPSIHDRTRNDTSKTSLVLVSVI